MWLDPHRRGSTWRESEGEVEAREGRLDRAVMAPCGGRVKRRWWQGRGCLIHQFTAPGGRVEGAVREGGWRPAKARSKAPT